jgi:hypothetical protein
MLRITDPVLVHNWILRLLLHIDLRFALICRDVLKLS